MSRSQSLLPLPGAGFVIAATCLCVTTLMGVQSVSAQVEPEPPYESRFIDAGGVRLHYLDVGGEGLPLVFVHSEGWDAYTYEDFAPRFTDRNRVLAVTRRGYGQSEGRGSGYDVPSQGESLIDFLDALAIERAVFAGNASATSELTYLAEHHPERVGGLVYFTGLATPWLEEDESDPTRALEMYRRANPAEEHYEGQAADRAQARSEYRPEFLRGDRPTITVPALAFVARSGTMGQEHGIGALALVGSPLMSEVRSQMPPSPAREYLDRLATDEAFRRQELERIPDPVAREYFIDLASNEALQAAVQRYHEETIVPAVLSAQEQFRRAFGDNLRLVRLDVSQVMGYEYRDSPELIEPHIRRFLDGVGEREQRRSGSRSGSPAYARTAGLDTVHVAAPTGEKDIDRASILAALDQVEPGGTIRFAPGTYLIGEIIHVTVPGISVVGHPDGTTLRGCHPDVFPRQAGVEETFVAVMSCNGLDMAGGHQTVRGLTFEYAWHALVLGGMECIEGRGCVPVLQPVESRSGGYRVENNTFRNTTNGIRTLGQWSEPAVIRGNRFINTFHAVVVHGSIVHVVENEISVPEPERVPSTGHPGGAMIVSATDLNLEAALLCAGNVIAGNRISGHPDGIAIRLFRAGVSCRDNVIRENAIAVERVKVPASWWGVTLTESDSSVVGVPIALINEPKADPEVLGSAEVDEQEGLLEGNLIEGNAISGAEGIGIELLHASGNRIVNNTITGIAPRDPFPGIIVNSFDPQKSGWREANGSGIWISPGSDGNEVADNTFEDIASFAVVLEGDSNLVVLRRPDDVVQDLGSGNEVIDRTDETERTTPPAEPAGLGGAQEPALADTISDLAVESMELWNRLDPDAWLALFGDSVRWYYGATSLDRAGVEDMVRGLMSFTREADYRVLSEPDVEVLGPDAAVASFAMVQSATGINGAELDEPTGLTFVYERRESDWKIMRVHESMGVPPDSVVAETILSRTRELARAWERLDADAYLAHFSEDLTFYFEGSRVSGTEFEIVVRQTIGSLRESTFEVLNPEVEVLGPNAAVISFELREVMIDASGASTDLRGVLTLVFERRRGQWLVVRAHETLRPPDRR